MIENYHITKYMGLLSCGDIVGSKGVYMVGNGEDENFFY